MGGRPAQHWGGRIWQRCVRHSRRAEMPPAPRKISPKRATILIVDDDEDIRDSVAEMLEAVGYATVTAANGKEALDLLLSSRVIPNLIILDLKMPERSGYEVLEVLRHSVTFVKVPVIVLSAHLRFLPQ